MQSYVLHSALQCLACKLHYGIEYNEGLITFVVIYGFTCASTLQELWIISSCRRYVFQCLFCCSQQCVEVSTVRAWSPDPKAESLPSRKVGWWNPVSASQREQSSYVQFWEVSDKCSSCDNTGLLLRNHSFSNIFDQNIFAQQDKPTSDNSVCDQRSMQMSRQVGPVIDEMLTV